MKEKKGRREGGEKGREYVFYNKFAEVRMKDRLRGKKGRREGREKGRKGEGKGICILQ